VIDRVLLYKKTTEFYLGIDVAKAKLDCCLLIDTQTLKRKKKRLKIMPKVSVNY